MKHKDEGNEQTHTSLMVRFTAVCRRFLSMTEVVHDATGPWLRGGRAKDVIQSSEVNAEAIEMACIGLLRSLALGHTLLQVNSASLQEVEALCLTFEQRQDENHAGPKLHDTSEQLLSLTSDVCRETAELIRSFWDSPTTWCSSQALENDDERLHNVLTSLDYTRWQILKWLAKLVIIFDDHDCSDSDKPCEAWQKDQAAYGQQMIG